MRKIFSKIDKFIERREKQKYEVTLNSLPRKFEIIDSVKMESYIFKSRFKNIIVVTELMRNIANALDKNYQLIVEPLGNANYISMEEFFATANRSLSMSENISEMLKQYNRCKKHQEEIDESIQKNKSMPLGNTSFNYGQCKFYINLIKEEIFKELIAYLK